MSRRIVVALVIAGTLAGAGCGRSDPPPPRTLSGTWSRENERLKTILAFYRDGDRLWFRWIRHAEDRKRVTDCSWDGACVESVLGKPVGEYRCTLEAVTGPDEATVSCRGWLDEGRRIEMSWTDDFVLDPDGKTLRCYTKETNGQSFEGEARPLRVFTKVAESVAYPPKRTGS